jgi:3-oxoadipate enol-lactonase
MPMLDRANESLYYEVHGEGDPLLCIMGLGGNIHFWEFQIPAFAERYRTIAFDNRGAGRSDKPAGPYTMQLLADDAIALLDAVGVERAHVIGISMGGMIAQDLVLRYPSRVGSLVLAATFARPDDKARTLAVEGSAQVGAPSPLSMLQGGTMDLSTIDLKQLFKFMMTLILTPEFIQREKPWLRSLLERAQQYGFSPEAFMAQVSAILNHDAAEKLRELKTPTLVMTGTADVLVPPHHSDELAALIPGATLVRIEGGTHGFNVERKEEFNKVVLDFLREHPL